MSITGLTRLSLLAGMAFAVSGCSILYDIAGYTGISEPRKSIEQGSTSYDESDGASANASVIRVANETYQRGDINTAVGLYQRAYELEPSDPKPLLMIGKIFNKQGNGLKAGQAYRQALAVDPLNVEAKRGLGLAFLSRGQTALAIEQFSEGLAIEKNVKLLNAMGVAYDKRGERQTAQRYYKEGLEIEPDNLMLRSNLGLSMAYEGRFDEAIAVLKKVTKEPTAQVKHRQILAMAYSLAGNYDAAEQTSRIDMSDEQVAQRMRFFRSLKRPDNSVTAATKLVPIEEKPLSF